MPEPVPPPSEWHTWKPAAVHQAQQAACEPDLAAEQHRMSG